ncbi:FAD-binding oxidoreductase [Vibrio navarrensis]|uniref:FAD-binding oxidoreductase n=1 Tax=Vibrio navarrensis TaxID=29495 RepID=UPI001865D51B|nr:FAD-dependent oxidoreductase [Vibrio navarrensis]MBE3651720.1 FAD-binding protein [Vibrio navarrensis]
MNNMMQNVRYEDQNTPYEQLLRAEQLMASYQQLLTAFIEQLQALKIEYLTSTHTPDSETEGLTKYLAQTVIFNTRLRAYPAVIVMCKSNDDVVQAYQHAIALNLPIRVRSGGHDHEGECTGNDVILLDLSGLKKLCVEGDEKSGFIAHIGSGYRFYQLVPKLAAHSPPITIPHGTCATVGLAGYIQGGGWGPWTRRHGMCCESLIGAKVLVENGSILEVNEQSHGDLLWALRGGGAFSYGIVLEFSVKAFVIPNEIHRFEIHWNDDDTDSTEETTYEILSYWEKAINDPSTIGLVGTNLKIDAIAKTDTNAQILINRLKHPCTMYGYWEGDPQSLSQFTNKYFPSSKHRITGTDTPKSYSPSLMGNWARKSLGGKLNTSLKDAHEPFKPDYDEPAPHKITSKVVSEQGLEDLGRTQLLKSLTSSLLFEKNQELGLFSYVTLGAINGPFYADEDSAKASERMAFPYATSQYTIQYQTWWNECFNQKALGQNNDVFNYVNRALDWMEVCRDSEINGTKGAFISFKDSSIPTKTYFLDHYEKLINIKQKYNRQPSNQNSDLPGTAYNHYRTRKTII